MKRRYFTENGKTFIECKSYYHTDIFEVVDEFPQGYVVWRVPYDMPDFGYIALAKPDSTPHHIIRKELKCLYVGEELERKLSDCSETCITALNFNEIIRKLKK